MKKFDDMIITFCIVAYNEAGAIDNLLLDLTNQDYPHKKIEVVLIDGKSTDSTKEIMLKFKTENENDFYNILVLDNNKKTLPCGWNVALENYTGDAIVRVDAHARIPNDFIKKNIIHLSNDEYVCGGYRPNIISDETKWNKMLLSAETSMFGSSIADYRRQSKDRCVNSIFHGAYRREVFDKIGGYNEKLTRTEDNDIHYRMREAGFDIHFHSDIISYQHIRSTFKKMIKQKYLNGYWIGMTMGINPKCFSLYHFVPFAFIIGIILTTVLSFMGFWQLSALMWSLYVLFAVFNTVSSFIRDNFNPFDLLLPFVYFTLHMAYGMGTLIGLIKMPFVKKI